MAMAMALRRLASSIDKLIRLLFNGGSLYYMSPKQLNSPLEAVDPEIANTIEHEKARQWKVIDEGLGVLLLHKCGLQLIPSENFTSVSVMQAVGSVMTNTVRYIDMAQSLCQKRALEAFRLDPAKWGVNVQPLSSANFQVYTGLLKPHDRIMAHDRIIVGIYPLDIRCESQLEKSATLFRPKLIVAGASAYARLYDYARIRKVCDKQKAILLADMAHISGLVAAGVIPSPFEYADVVTTTTHKSSALVYMVCDKQKAILLADMAHISGLVAAGVIPSPFEYADVVTTTTHKSLRGPRGAMIFFRKGVKEINKQGKEATTPEYRAYQEQVLSNCSRFAQTLVEKGYEIVSGGTENHLVLVNLKNKGIDGSRVEKVLESVHIAANKNTVPGDVSAMVPGGIRMGTPALTSRGFVEEDFAKVAEFFDASVKLAVKIKAETKGTKLKDFLAVQSAPHFQSEITKLRHEVEAYAKQFPTVGFEKESMKYKD
ncbi:serine hydroxymethyltransferase [Quercus suber]|uniref:Serine hydroxymethyltransferase n=1 Tax=Quercus suber TaxID=58331 RepID=A0AAW0IWB6_QUESU